MTSVLELLAVVIFTGMLGIVTFHVYDTVEALWPKRKRIRY